MIYYLTFFLIIIIIILLVLLYRIKNIYDNESKSSLEVQDNASDNSNGKIPKIIIQTWKSNVVPQRYMSLIESVKINNPDYNYLFFTDENIEDFFKMHYPSYYHTYLKLPVKIQKIDFFRYVAIYHYGGFYLDLDMNVLQPFDKLLKYSCVFPIDEYIDVRLCKHLRYKPYCDRGQTFLLGQYAFAAAPKHPFIKELIDKIHSNINKYIKNVNYESEDYIYKTTGPDFVTDIYMDYKDKNSISILDVGRRQYFGNYAVHNFFGTWK
jgi:inositol phosphorylceramide mannosyltransferase catalytic subunit